MKQRTLLCLLALALSINAAQALEHQDGPASLHQAVGLLGQQSFRDAAAAFDKAIQSGVTGKMVYRCRGFARLLSGKPATAIDDFSRAIRDDEKDAVLHYGRGAARRLLGRNDEALSDFNRAIELNPRYGGALAARSRLLAERGDSEAALRDFEQLTRLLPDPLSSTKSLKQFSDKKSSLSVGTEIDLTYCSSYEWWSALFREFRALDVEDRGEQGSADSRTRRHQALRVAVDGDLERGLALLTKAAEASPKDAKVHQLRGILLALKGDWKNALSAFTRAIEAEPKQMDLYLSRATIYNVLGEFENGMKDTAVVQRQWDNDAVSEMPIRIGAEQ